MHIYHCTHYTLCECVCVLNGAQPGAISRYALQMFAIKQTFCWKIVQILFGIYFKIRFFYYMHENKTITTFLRVLFAFHFVVFSLVVIFAPHIDFMFHQKSIYGESVNKTTEKKDSDAKNGYYCYKANVLCSIQL